MPHFIHRSTRAISLIISTQQTGQLVLAYCAMIVLLRSYTLRCISFRGASLLLLVTSQVKIKSRLVWIRWWHASNSSLSPILVAVPPLRPLQEHDYSVVASHTLCAFKCFVCGSCKKRSNRAVKWRLHRRYSVLAAADLERKHAYAFIYVRTTISRARCSIVVKALCYKPEGRGFVTRSD
jgi:hypothetical protein